MKTTTKPKIKFDYTGRIDVLIRTGHVCVQARAVSDTPWGQVDFVELFEGKMTRSRQRLFEEMAEQALFRFLVNSINRRQTKRHLKRRLKWVS